MEDLSTDGALLKDGFVPPVGEEVSLKLLLPEGTLDLQARVVRHHFSPSERAVSRFPGALAVCFDQLTSDQIETLHDTVVDIILRDWKPRAEAAYD